MNRLLNSPLRLWRKPVGRPLYVLAAALAALWAGWLFAFQILLLPRSGYSPFAITSAR